MDKEILLILVGGGIGLFSSIITTLLNFYLAERKERAAREREVSKERAGQLIQTVDAIGQYEELNTRRKFASRPSGRMRMMELPDRIKGCFGPMAKVMLADGEKKNAAQIEKGDLLATFDEGGTKKGSCKVAVAQKIRVQKSAKWPGMIAVSGDQIVLTRFGLMSASSLKDGIELVTDQRTLHRLSFVEHYLGSANEFVAIRLEKPSIISVDGFLYGDHSVKNFFD